MLMLMLVLVLMLDSSWLGGGRVRGIFSFQQTSTDDSIPFLSFFPFFFFSRVDMR